MDMHGHGEIRADKKERELATEKSIKINKDVVTYFIEVYHMSFRIYRFVYTQAYDSFSNKSIKCFFLLAKGH